MDVNCILLCIVIFFFKQKTAYEIGTGDWSSDVCSSDLVLSLFCWWSAFHLYSAEMSATLKTIQTMQTFQYRDRKSVV